ncbi:unnamed protein product [Mytilus edulis]|uniref:Uncharacterized protein n=1 Tax=Mytilus edulis TaxID=6550 RepID=A0A8S3SCC5_MYTED|nr:unnamed protein product [Mytilus edulis]
MMVLTTPTGQRETVLEILLDKLAEMTYRRQELEVKKTSTAIGGGLIWNLHEVSGMSTKINLILLESHIDTRALAYTETDQPCNFMSERYISLISCILQKVKIGEGFIWIVVSLISGIIAKWKYNEPVRGYALPDTGCNGKWIVKFIDSEAKWQSNQTVLGPQSPGTIGFYKMTIEENEIVYAANLSLFSADWIIDKGYNRKKIVMFKDTKAVNSDKLLDMFRIVKETYSPGERDIKILDTSCYNAAHTRPKGKEPNSIFECISVVILWCAFEVIWITYYMQDRQAVTHKELSLTDIFSKKGGTGTAYSDLNETSGGLMAQPTNDILNIQSDDIVLLNVQKHTNKT